MARRAPISGWALVRSGWEQASIYLPIILMGFMALGTYWLARSTPTASSPEAMRAVHHDPDYFMRGFSVKSFDAAGRLKSEVFGVEARHYPDTDTLEIDHPRIRAYNERGELTVATALRAVSNADASEVQLIGEAVVTREPMKGSAAQDSPRLEFRGEFLHVFVKAEKVKSHKPVVLKRGADEFTAESLDFDNVDRVLDLRGRVHGMLAARPSK
ncbi:MAG: LPS export ABC transporter periplasmic protein LptC [Burkholderiales bacterium]|nr:LPS export ABC transporter periplasmic protein LptC [Burkholderiales bacterium]